MTNILIESYQNIPSFKLTVNDFKRYTKIIPLNVRVRLARQIRPRDISWCDVLVSVRCGNPLSEYIVRETIRAGRKVALMIDDDLVAYTPNQLNYAEKSYKKALIAALQMADCMITTSKFLGEKYKKEYGLRYVLTNTIIDSSQFKPYMNEKRDNGRIKMIYAAGIQHKVFFNEYITPILNTLYERYGNSLSLTIIGPDINLEGISMDVSKIPSMPFEDYREFMNTHDFDIGLAPLYDNDFCKSKYFNKYLEYSTNLICGIYSNVPPYNHVIKDSYNGYLAENNTSSWYKTICKAIDDLNKTHKCIENAKIQITSDYSLKNVTNSLYADIKDILSYKAPQCRCRYAKYVLPIYVYNILKRRFFTHVLRL